MVTHEGASVLQQKQERERERERESKEQRAERWKDTPDPLLDGILQVCSW